MFDHTTFYTARFNTDCRFTHVSTSITQLFGLPAKYFIGKHISETGRLGDDKQVANLESMIKKVFVEGDANIFEARWDTLEGERHFDILYIPERNEEGSVESVLSVYKYKPVESVQHENETFLQALPDAIPVPIFYKDRQGRYLGFNEAYEEFFGASRDQLVGKSVFDISPRELAEIYYAKDNELFESGGIQRYESQVRNTFGDLRDVVFNKAVFTDSQGSIKGLIGAIFDITERKQMVNTLKNVNRELQAISQCHQTMLRAIDEQSLIEEIGRIIVEEAGCRMSWVGYIEHDEAKSITPKAVAGRGDKDVECIHSAQFTWSEDSDHACGIAGEAIRSGLYAYAPDIASDPRMGSWREIALERGCISALALPLMDENSSVFGVMVVYSSEANAFAPEEIRLMDGLSRDLAFGINVIRAREERKRAEEEREKLQEQLMQAQKLDAIGRLAGGVAHDFNNMLGAIIGNLDLALRHVNLDQQTHSYLEEARLAADRSAALTRQLLAFARKQKVSPKVINLNDAVEGTLKMLRRLIGDGIRLEWSPYNMLWPVRLDPSQADQILANLCVNARDAIDGIGEIIIRTSNASMSDSDCITISDSIPGEYVCLSITDSGCGMDNETIRNVFEPFFSTHEEGKGTGKGTGLGLSIVYGIVKQNSGFISIDAEPESGSTFHIYLPRHVGEVEEEMNEEIIKVKNARGNETILLVEDEPAMLTMVHSILSNYGYHVLASSSPTEAITIASDYTKTGNIDLLITDMIMPDMNGNDLAKTISDSICPDIKILIMSGFLGDFSLNASARFIQKPFNIKNLISEIQKLLE